MKDFYYILGVETDASQAEINDAYRKLSKKFHPDLNSNDSYFESRFKAIQEAYEMLCDPATRRKYDADHKRYKSYPEEINKKRRSIKLGAIDIAFTLILILVTLFFGDYVVRVISSYKAPKVTATVNTTPVVTLAAEPPQTLPILNKHHVKFKTQPGALSVPAKHINTKPVQIRSVSVNNNSVENKPVEAPLEKDNIPEPVRAVAAVAQPAYLYSANITANATGVVNMHLRDNLTSNVIAVIPNHSTVHVLEKGGSYCKVEYANSTGYVPSWTVESR